ncbi:hypothetical protein C8R44DRAFT_941263 [Mycena epipterygia]|nr:hypothetical protein C8R44DRAFT_941263 [Mycena epipterygia]
MSYTKVAETMKETVCNVERSLSHGNQLAPSQISCGPLHPSNIYTMVEMTITPLGGVGRSFAIFFANQDGPTDSHPVNKRVGEMVGDYAKPWNGNLLVLRVDRATRKYKNLVYGDARATLGRSLRLDNYAARLPTELIARIFTELFQRVTLLHWVALPFHRGAVAAVCYEWKQIAYSRVFWTAIGVHRFSRPSYITFCLAQAQGMPVELFLDSSHHRELPYPRRIPRMRSLAEWADEVLPSVALAAPSVYRLRLDCSSDIAWRYAMFCLTEFSWVSLEHLSVDVSRPFVTLEQQFPFCIAALRSNASHMFFRFILLRWTDDVLVYASLTHLTLEHISQSMNVGWDAVKAMLEQAMNVTELTLVDVDCGDQELRPVRMGKLCRLAVELYKPSSLILAAALRAPFLRDARITVRASLLLDLSIRCRPLLASLDALVLNMGIHGIADIDRVLAALSATALELFVGELYFAPLLVGVAKAKLHHVQLLQLPFTLGAHLDMLAAGSILANLAPWGCLVTSPMSPWRQVLEWRVDEGVVRAEAIARGQNLVW